VVKSATNEWRLAVDPAGSGFTIVTLTTHVDCGPRPPQQLIARLVARGLARASDVMLAGLANHLTGDAVSGTGVTADSSKER
jgi:hypothetical protein